MSCSNCESSGVVVQVGSCETELLNAVKAEVFKTVAALPPHLQRYLSCRLGLSAQSTAQAFDPSLLIAALPAIVRLLIQLGIIPASKTPTPAIPAQAAAPASDPWLRAMAAGAAAFAAASVDVAAPTIPPAPPALDPAGYTPRSVRRCA